MKSSVNSEKVDKILMLIRNLIESDKRYEFSIIKFYCDWILHPQKDYITTKMKSLFEEALKNEDSFVQRFLEARDLHSELKKFFEAFKLPKMLIDDTIFWKSLKNEIFAKVTNRPIVKPISEIAEICFFENKDNCLFFAIRYNKKKKCNAWPVFSSYQIKK